MTSKILLTGFAPFEQQRINPSWLAVQQCQQTWPYPAIELHILELPVSFKNAFAPLAQAIRELKPDVVLAVGQAGGRAAPGLEQVAINLMQARIADNDGYQPQQRPVLEGQPTAYFTTLPLASMLHAAHAAEHPLTVSYTAGTFVCNALFYQLMNFCETLGDAAPRAGFLHIPYAPTQVLTGQAPSMAIAEIVALLQCILPVAFEASSATPLQPNMGALD